MPMNLFRGVEQVQAPATSGLRSARFLHRLKPPRKRGKRTYPRKSHPWGSTLADESGRLYGVGLGAFGRPVLPFDELRAAARGRARGRRERHRTRFPPIRTDPYDGWSTLGGTTDAHTQISRCVSPRPRACPGAAGGGRGPVPVPACGPRPRGGHPYGGRRPVETGELRAQLWRLRPRSASGLAVLPLVWQGAPDRVSTPACSRPRPLADGPGLFRGLQQGRRGSGRSPAGHGRSA